MTDPRETPDAPGATAGGITPADAAALLRVAGDERSRLTDAIVRPTIYIVLGWGIAWFVGFGLFWAVATFPEQLSSLRPVVGIPFGLLMAGGVVNSIVLGTRTSRGMRGEERRQGAMYGAAWAVSCGGASVLITLLGLRGVPGDVLQAVAPAIFSVVVGALYIAGAALWNDRTMLWLGVWIVVVGVLGPFAPAPYSWAIMALAGGGAFLVYAAASLIGQRRRATARVSLGGAA